MTVALGSFTFWSDVVFSSTGGVYYMRFTKMPGWDGLFWTIGKTLHDDYLANFEGRILMAEDSRFRGYRCVCLRREVDDTRSVLLCRRLPVLWAHSRPCTSTLPATIRLVSHAVPIFFVPFFFLSFSFSFPSTIFVAHWLCHCVCNWPAGLTRPDRAVRWRC